MSATAVIHYSQVAQQWQNFKLVGAATNNATLVKAGATMLTSLVAGNINAAVRFLKFYDKATAPVPGTDIPVMVVPLPANGVPVMLEWPMGYQFKLGLGLSITTGITDADNTAVVISEQVVSLQLT